MGGWTLAGDDGYIKITIAKSGYLASLAGSSGGGTTATALGAESSGLVLPGMNGSVDAVMAL